MVKKGAQLQRVHWYFTTTKIPNPVPSLSQILSLPFPKSFALPFLNPFPSLSKILDLSPLTKHQFPNSIQLYAVWLQIRFVTPKLESSSVPWPTPGCQLPSGLLIPGHCQSAEFFPLSLSQPVLAFRPPPTHPSVFLCTLCFSPC